jgi:hypothetical protein
VSGWVSALTGGFESGNHGGTERAGPRAAQSFLNQGTAPAPPEPAYSMGSRGLKLFFLRDTKQVSTESAARRGRESPPKHALSP